MLVARITSVPRRFGMFFFSSGSVVLERSLRSYDQLRNFRAGCAHYAGSAPFPSGCIMFSNWQRRFGTVASQLLVWQP
jgi:hypothetical protein